MILNGYLLPHALTRKEIDKIVKCPVIRTAVMITSMQYLTSNCKTQIKIICTSKKLMVGFQMANIATSSNRNTCVVSVNLKYQLALPKVPSNPRVREGGKYISSQLIHAALLCVIVLSDPATVEVYLIKLKLNVISSFHHP